MERALFATRVINFCVIKVDELEYWQIQRNKEKASINWMFDVDRARQKLGRAYEKLNCQN